MDFTVDGILERCRALDEKKARIKNIVGSLTGFTGNVAPLFQCVGHTKIWTGPQSAWIVDIEPDKKETAVRSLYVAEVAYLFEGKSVFEHNRKPGKAPYEFEDLFVSQVNEDLDAFVVSMVKWFPEVKSALERLWQL